MRYVLARAKQANETKAYRVYVTDALQIISENTGSAVQKGRYLSQRFADLAYTDRTEQEEDPRNCKEIVDEMWRNLRGEEVEHGKPV